MERAVRQTLIGLAAAGVLAASPAFAAPSPTADDGEWLTLTGTVEAISGKDFALDYGRNTITVEMDDYDWFNENVVKPGDQVTVTGRIDNDFFQARKLEASSVYIASLHTRFFANAADEEDYLPAIDRSLGSNNGLTVTGMVQSIDGEDMIVDAGALDYRVDTGTLNYDPFDVTGVQHIAIGDRVEVTGSFDDSDFFDRPEIDATVLTELSV